MRRSGLGFSPFSPLAGGWLTGKYRRGEAPPAGSRMTLRSEPYEHLQRDDVFDALERLEADGGRARRRHGDARAGLAAGARRSSTRSSSARAGRRTSSPRCAALELALGDAEHRRALGALPAIARSRSMTVRVLSGDDVRAALTMTRLHRGHGRRAARSSRRATSTCRCAPSCARRKSPGLMGLMTAHRAGDAPAFGLKAVAIFPENPTRGLDAHQGVVVVFDGEDGPRDRPASTPPPITAIRTAAVSAVATRALAREGASTLAVLGAGRAGRGAHRGDGLRAAARARAHLLAPPRARRSARRRDGRALRVGRERGRRRSRTRCATPTSSSRRRRRASRSSSAPGSLPGAHVNAVGSSIPTTRELDGATMAAARIVVDARESALNESGDILLAHARGHARPTTWRSPSSARC